MYNAPRSLCTWCTSTNCGFRTTDGAPEQFVLWRFNTAPFFGAFDKCRTCTSDKLEKCMLSVVFNMSKFIPKQHSRTTLIFCLHSKKTAADSYRLLREAYGEHAPSQDTCERWFRRFKGVTST